MIKSPSIPVAALSALVAASLVGAFSGDPAWAQTAKKLKCTGCVKSKQIKDGEVKTNDLAKKAVKSTKIANGAVTATKIGDGAVTSAKIGDGAVTSAKIGDGAVTFEKLAADAVFTNVVVVSPVGPTATDNCDALRSALAGITGNDAGNRYLVFLEPGVYACGATPVQMKPFVAIQGSGQSVTEITGNVVAGGFGPVEMVANTEISHLTVTNTGGSSQIALVGNGVNLRISDVTARALDATFNAIGLLLIGNCEATITNVTTIGSSPGNPAGNHRGANFNCDSVTAVNLVAKGDDDGLRNDGSGVTVRHSVMEGGSSGVRNLGDPVTLVYSEVVGGVTGSASCLGLYDASLAPVTCTP